MIHWILNILHCFGLWWLWLYKQLLQLGILLLRGSCSYFCNCISFKTRFYNHTKSFNNETYKKETKLSTYIWDLKENEEEYKIEWEIVAKCNPYKCGTNKCSICSTEKLLIMKYNNMPTINLLNKRNEILNKCRHKTKFKLINIK